MAKVGKGRTVFIAGVRYDEGAELPKDADVDEVVTSDVDDEADVGNAAATPAPVVTAKESKSSSKQSG